jgi:ATP-binding cassette subfamily B protein
MIQYQKQYSNPVTQIATVLNTLQSAVASAERVFELLDEKEEVETSDDYKTLDKVEGNISFEHLKFGYTPDKLLMTDINVDVKKGQMIAIVGPTGAGKTTLVNLLMRFYEPNGGQITIDGMNIRDMTRHDLRDIFGMVLQETWLFSGTIHDNIAYGKNGATEEQIKAAAKAAQVEFFFETMPDGYDTMLDEEASNISQGQKQLLTIARAMLADPPILILDEATSSVDTRTEAIIQQAMSNLLKGRTSFVIAHRLSTIKDADLILYMENGNIVEQGSHTSLMEQGGKYAELYNSQFAQD